MPFHIRNASRLPVCVANTSKRVQRLNRAPGHYENNASFVRLTTPKSYEDFGFVTRYSLAYPLLTKEVPVHAWIAAFFAMLFSFSHAQTLHHSEVALASDTRPFVQQAAPTREEVNYEQFETVTSYAEDSCVSCRRMNVVYDAR